MAFEAGKTVGDWTLVSDVDNKLAAPLWVAEGDDGAVRIEPYCLAGAPPP